MNNILEATLQIKDKNIIWDDKEPIILMSSFFISPLYSL